MFLKKVKSFTHRISFRLSVIYLAFIVPIFLLTFFIFHKIANNFLVKRDQNEIESKIQQIEEVIEKDEIESVKKFLNSERFKADSAKFFIMLSQEGKVIHSQNPTGMNNFKTSYFKKRVESITSDEWYYISSKAGDENALEVKRITFDGFRLDVGLSTDDRDELIEKFKKIFILIFIPTLLVIIFGSMLISEKLLSPLKQLTKTIYDVQGGNLKSRTPLPEVQDEIYQISVAFNSMLDQIQNLVQTINYTLDGVAHDLKTPLTRMRIASELAIHSDSKSDLIEANQNAIEVCDSLITLINTIMMQSRVESRTAMLKITEFNVLDIIKEIEDLYYFTADEKKIKINIIAKPFLFKADLVYFKQVVANLVDNAIKYSPMNSVITIDAFINPSTQRMHLIVEDSGIGISEDEILKIWERLYRSDKSRHAQGSGLGLSVVKAIVEAHGGSVSVKSRINEGSTFEVQFPCST